MIKLSEEQMRQVMDLTKSLGMCRPEVEREIGKALLQVIRAERQRCSELIRQLSALGEELKQEGLQTPNYATDWVLTDIRDGTKIEDSKLHVRSGISVIQGNV